MTVVNISWYLCVLFVVALAAESAITVAPGGEAMVRLLMGLWAAPAVVSVAVVVTLGRLCVSEAKQPVPTFLAAAPAATLTRPTPSCGYG